MKVEFKSNFKAFDKLFTKAKKDSLIEIGLIMKKEAERHVPVDTGKLRDSIDFKFNVEDGEVVLYADETYAAAVEFGTSKQKSQPFMQPAVNKGANAVDNVLKENMKFK